MVCHAASVSRKLSMEAEKVTLSLSDWFFQSIQQYLVDYMCLIFGKKKKNFRITDEKKPKKYCGIIHDADSKNKALSNQSPCGSSLTSHVGLKKKPWESGM